MHSRTRVPGLLANVVSVVDSRNPPLMEIEHGPHMHRHGLAGCLRDLGGFGLRLRAPLLNRPTQGQVAVHWIMGGSLIGDHVRPHAARDELGEDLGGVAQQCHRDRCTIDARILDHRQGFVQVRSFLVYITGAQAKVDARLITFDDEHTEPRHDRRQRLRTAHATQTCRQNPFTPGIAPVVLPRQFVEGFVSALNDALAADVDP